MQVETREFRNNLSRYLKRITESGETIILLDRNQPIAKIAPVRGKQRAPASAWKKERSLLLAKAAKLGISISLPEKEPKPLRETIFKPQIAPDGRTDIETVVRMRREKDS